MNYVVTGNPTTESAYAGLVIAVMTLLALFLKDRLSSLLIFARWRFAANGMTRRKAATALFLLGLIPNGFLSLWVRSTNGPVPVEWRTWINFPAWTFFALAIILYAASDLLDGEPGCSMTLKERERRLKLARRYVLVMVGGIVVCTVAFAWLKPFHGPYRILADAGLPR